MQKTLIKSILAVAVAGTFATCANAAVPNDRNDWLTATGTMTGSIDSTKVQENFENLDTRVDENKANIDKVNEKADLANRANDVQNKQIAGLQSANLAQDKLIAANKSDIAANKTDIATNKADIATNKANIEANKNAIAANYAEMKNNFAAVNSRIDKLDDKMKKGFAAQAALNGLFQPYSVGKFNVTAAIGGYDSEQAMALGTGYRFNENFALKAGIASDLSGFDHVTYNIGANFEF